MLCCCWQDVVLSAKLTNRGLGTGVAATSTRSFDLGVPHVSTQFEEEDEDSEEEEESVRGHTPCHYTCTSIVALSGCMAAYM